MTENEQQTYTWRIERAIPYSFAIVDAMLWEFLVEHPKIDIFTARRQVVTTGSARYKVQLTKRKKDGDVGIFYVRAISDHITCIQIMPGDLMEKEGKDQVDLFAGIWNSMLHMMILQIREQEKEMEELIIREGKFESKNIPLSDRTIDPALLARIEARGGRSTPESAPHLGRPVNELNEWARQQVQLGRSRAQVFQEYLRRRDTDPNDENEMEKAKDAFRKALARTKRT